MQNCKTMVVKLGSSTLVDGQNTLRASVITSLAHQAAQLQDMGWNLVVVTSGAIACGVGELKFSKRPQDIASLQACASVGQATLTAAYDKAFKEVGIASSLVLISRDDMQDDESRAYARAAFEKLLELGIVPIVNENDVMSAEDILIGDNDTLAAQVSKLISADLCVTISDVDGLYTANPALDSAAKPIPVVHEIDDYILGLAGDSSSDIGTGGMITKLQACHSLMQAGIESVICSRDHEQTLVRIAQGEQLGTRFTVNI